MSNNINWESYDQRLTTIEQDENVSGFAFAVIKNNEIIFQKGVGYTCHDGGKKVEAHTLLLNHEYW